MLNKSLEEAQAQQGKNMEEFQKGFCDWIKDNQQTKVTIENQNFHIQVWYGDHHRDGLDSWT